jgi:hypothetical protein
LAVTTIRQFIAEVRDVLSDPSGGKYPADRLVRTADRQLNVMSRILTRGPKQWHNLTIGLAKTGARKLFSNVFEYRLPAWITSVVSVHQMLAPPTTVVLSPYVWSQDTAQYGHPIPKGTRDSHAQRWQWEGGSTLRVLNMVEPLDLLLAVVKAAPTMFECTLDQDSLTTATAVLPAAFEYGEKVDADGYYINSELLVAAAADDGNYGLQLRIVNSDPRYVGGGGRQHRITFSSLTAAVLKKDDVLLSLVPLSEDHIRLLVLLTANALMQRPAHASGMNAIATELAEEMANFKSYASGDRDNAITFYKSGRLGSRHTPDRDRRFGYF